MRPMILPVPSKVPTTHTFAASMKALEDAYLLAQFAQKRSRYVTLLRRLPDWLLASVCNSGSGDPTAASLLVVLVIRTGNLLHEKRSPVAVAATTEREQEENEAIKRFAPVVLRDCAREMLVRDGYLRTFEPNPDPFGLEYTHLAPVMKLSARGASATGETRELLDRLFEV